MHISQETVEQTQARLLKVIAKATLKTFPETYAFDEYPREEFSKHFNPTALACVRDHDVWSQLVPSKEQAKELFGLLSFHFEDGADNSGFVGWLASHLKAVLGTGVFVVCGQNSQQGGIFDYWGCPAVLTQAVFDEIESLRQQGLILLQEDTP